MSNLLFHANHQVDVPILVLQSKSGKSYGAINGAADITYKKNLNSANELSFTVHKHLNGSVNPLWEHISDLKNIYIPEFQEKFEITVSYSDAEQETKSITATSLCEAELGQLILRGLEVNTENDLLSNSTEDYPITVFYREISDSDDKTTQELKKKHSLLHRILSAKASYYHIGHVDDSLKDLSFEFTADGTSIYDFLTGDVAEKMQCLFLFDSMTRTINVYDLCSTCNNCYDEVIGVPAEKRKHFRGDFHDFCPNCGSTNITEGYGKDTTILIDRENLASSLTKEGNADSLKNCFYVEGGDETINAAFAQLNPNGSQYIYCFSPDALSDMPKSLQNAITEYDKKYDYYTYNNIIDTKTTAHEYREKESPHMTSIPFDSDNPDCIPDNHYVTAFNTVLSKVSSLSNKKPYIDYNYHIPFSFVGQSDLVTYYYNAIDLQLFLENSMMPTYEMETYDKYEALSRLNTVAFGTVAVAGLNDTNAIKSIIENVILNKAKTLINTALFSVDIAESASSVTAHTTNGQKTYTGTWTGTFSITDRKNDDDKTNTITNRTYSRIAQAEGREIPTNIPASVTIKLDDDVISYAQNSISYMISKKDLPAAADIYLPDVTPDDFQKEAMLHSKSNLMIFQNVLTDCLSIITGQIQDLTVKTGEVYDKMVLYQKNYRQKQTIVTNLLSIRETQLSIVNHFLLLMEAYMGEVKDALNFEQFLKDYTAEHRLMQNLWEIFQYYRREGEYRNENIISDNLKSNADVVAYAGWLMNYAKKELLTAGTMQYSISTSLGNLLALPEFEPILQDFDVGNWIRVRMDIRDDQEDDIIYKLRLLSYQINFNESNFSNINVEFSTVTRTWNGLMSDAQSILKSAQSMAKSYSGVTRQLELDSKTTETVNHWVSDGLDMTNQMITENMDRQCLIIDSHGILAQKYDDLTDTYDDCQLKIFNNGIYTTHDNWNTLDAAVGKFIYKDPFNNWAETETYGIIAKKIVGEQILGEDLRIYNSSGSLQFTDNGLTISNEQNTVTINPNDNEKLFKITNTNKEDVFFTDRNGNLSITGKLTATEIITDSGNFSIDENGMLYAVNADISGNIAATGGSIGGFTINDTYLANGTSSLGTAANSVYLGTNGISCGTDFKVSSNGVLEAENAVISGIITATKGSFHGTINATGGTFSGNITSTGTISGGTISGSSITGGNINIYNGDFRVDTNGVLTAKKASISGSINATTLKVKNRYQIYDSDENTDITVIDYVFNGDNEFSQIKFGNPYYIVYLNGPVHTREDLSVSGSVMIDGETYIYNNLNVGTEKENAAYIDMGNKSKNKNCSIHRGNTSSNTAIGMYDNNKSHSIFTYKHSGDFTFHSDVTVSGGSSISTISDERLKHDIKDINEKYEAFYDKLTPRIFKYNDGTSGRIHTGFIAQEVEQALAESEITTDEFAGIIISERDEKDENFKGYDTEYSLRYEEFIALNTMEIQKLKEKNKLLEATLQKLIEKFSIEDK